MAIRRDVKKTRAVRKATKVRKKPARRVQHARRTASVRTTAPVVAWNDERPRSTWIEQLFLFERLAPDPPLIPANIEDRMLMFGYSNELCGETGFGWSKRLMLIHASLSNPDASEAARASSLGFGRKYG